MKKLSALLLGLSVLAAPAFADQADPDPKKPKAEKSSGKGKPGDACKTNDDCDQGSRPQSCRQNKCESRPVHPVT